MLSFAQTHYRSFVGRIGTQMKSAYTLDRENLSGGNAGDGC